MATNSANIVVSAASVASGGVANAAGIAGNLYGATGWPGLPAEYCEAQWYAAYTSANREKRVAEQLSVREVQHFLPTYSSVRRWKDRRVTLQLPLFPGYVFVRMALRDRLRILQIPGVARLVGFNGTPTALPEEEIEALMRGLEYAVHAEPHPYLTVGRRVRIKDGPLAGLEGILRRWKGNWRVVLSLDLIQRSVSVEIDRSNLEPASLFLAEKKPIHDEGDSRPWVIARPAV